MKLGPPIREKQPEGPEWVPIPGRQYWYQHRSMKAEDGSPCKKYAPPTPPPKYIIGPYMGAPYIDHETDWFGVGV